ncbi:hypothetical protein LguiB_009216 [Lonicera macranthoides]
MHWWQNGFSSSSPSSSSSSSSSSPANASKSHSSDDSVINTRSTRKSDMASLFSFRSKSRERGFGSQVRRLTRARKLRHLTDNEVCIPGPNLEQHELWLSPGSSEPSSARSQAGSPLPLPLPELAVLLRRDAALASSQLTNSAGKIPLPSPKDATNKGGEEREKVEAMNGDGNGNGDGVTSNAGIARRSSQDVGRNIEPGETQPSRKSIQEPNVAERIQNNNIPYTEHGETQPSRKSIREPNVTERIQNNMPNILVSGPASPFSSPALGPNPLPGELFTSSYLFPQGNQIWSAPEFPPPDMSLGLGSPYHMSLEKNVISVDNSPLHSPRASPRQNTRSFTGPPSPLPNRLSFDASMARRESNAQANVHPLPLPPGAAVPSQQPAPLQVTAKPDVMPIKGKWQKGKLIGRGTFGSVYVASNRETGALCAMKEVELLPDDPQSAECIRQLEQEIKVLSQLKHPNIVQYYGSEIVDDRFYIYLEYVHPGSINKYIRDHCGAMTESVVRNFTRHILSGLAYLHSTKTIHRDIKGANLLVDAYGVVKLADFGMAKHLTGQAAHLSLKGSPYWMAPELLQSVMQDNSDPNLALAVDIWSLGCTIIEMMNGKPPWSEFEGAAAMFKVLRESPPIPDSMSPEGKDFLRCCFRRNPAERPSASKLLEHRFLKNVQQLDVLSCTKAVHGMKLTEKSQTQKQRPGYKLELPVTIMQSTRQKVANTFMHGSFSPASLTNNLTT